MENVSFIGETLGPLFLFEPFDEPVSGTYGALSELDVEAVAKEWPFVDENVAREALLLTKNGILEDSDDGLLWEYRRLFVGPQAKVAPPWGSVYLDREQVIFGESTLTLRQWMRENGISWNTPEGDPEDHIGILLLMMSWIARNKPDLLNEFLEQHLMTWAPRFLEIVEGETESQFFIGLARLTRASLAGIADEFSVEVDTPRLYR